MTQPTEPSFEELTSSDGIRLLSDQLALAKSGLLIDLSSRLSKPEGTDLALQWSDELEARAAPEETLWVLNYFRANAWSDKSANRENAGARVWEWEQHELAQEILCLRKALNSSAFPGLASVRRCQILTNLGNQLNKTGRFVEALEYWTQALSIENNFWMAQGNRGTALLHYGKALYDRGHTILLLLFAHRYLSTALSVAFGLQTVPEPAHFWKSRACDERLVQPPVVRAA